MIFIFKCLICDEYPVKKETFKGFITPKKWAMLERAMGKGAIGGKVTFPQYCPQCFHVLEGVLVKVTALWPRPQKNKDPVS